MLYTFNSFAFRPRSNKYTHSYVQKLARAVSIWCHGKPASRNDLFKYTNGRFLVNETRETAKRYVKFDVDNLCKLISKLPTVSSQVIRIDKMEGGFNKALLMTTENGKEVIAKIRCPNVGLPRYSTASEAATLTFLKQRTSMPVPEILAWDCDPSNPVGAEYIIMDKAAGQQLFQVWGDMSEPHRYKLIQNLARLESSLASTQFPAYGNIYFRRSNIERSLNLDSKTDPDGLFCLGPAYNSEWPGDSLEQSEEVRNYSGPWETLSEFGIGLAKRGKWQVSHSKSSVVHGPHFGQLQEHERILDAAIQIIPVLAQTVALQSHAKPILWHTDLHLGNLFVAEDDPTEIVSMIDWQFLTVSPMFTQVRWPLFLSPPDGYQTGNIKPKLPPDYNEMDEDEKSYVRQMKDQAMLTKCYEGASMRYQGEAIATLTEVDDTIRDLFTRCENTYKEGIVPLRDSVITIVNNWENLSLPEAPPITFSLEEQIQHETEMAELQDWLKLRQYTQELLNSDAEGWVPPQLDFEEVRAKHSQLFELYMENKDPNVSDEEARRRWFYVEKN